MCRCVSLHNANYAGEGQFFTEQTYKMCYSAAYSAEVCDYASVRICEGGFANFICLFLLNGDPFFI